MKLRAGSFAAIFALNACAHLSYTQQVDQRVKSRNKAYRACFDTLYQDEAVGTTDGIRIEWVLAQSGEIKNMTTDASSKINRKLAACIMRSLNELQFPHPGHATRVRYPFVFTKRKSETDTNF